MRPQCEEKNWNSGNNLSDIPKMQNAINKDNILVFNFCVAALNALNFVSLYHLLPPPPTTPFNSPLCFACALSTSYPCILSNLLKKLCQFSRRGE